MPKFLSELTPAEWVKIAGLAVMGTVLYSDVQSSINEQQMLNHAQDRKIAELEITMKQAVVNQTDSNKDVTDALGRINETMSGLGSTTAQIEKRVERIERKL